MFLVHKNIEVIIMTEWYCNNYNKNIFGKIVCRKPAADPDKEYGIKTELDEVSSSGSHDALVTVEFFRDWGKSPLTETITPGDYKSYTDPDGVEWRVHVYSTIYNADWDGMLSSAEMGVCYDKSGDEPDDEPDDGEPDDGEPDDGIPPVDDDIPPVDDDIPPVDDEYPPKSELATDLSSIFGDIKPIYIIVAAIALILLR
jgi:hypothetical protein